MENAKEMSVLPDYYEIVTERPQPMLGAIANQPMAVSPMNKMMQAGQGLDAKADMKLEQKALTKAELAEMIFEQVGLNKREAKEIVDLFFDEIRDALVQGDSVKLSGFGNFTLRDKPQRPGRNPKTGEIIPIAARRVVTFHASQKLKAMVEGESETEVALDVLGLAQPAVLA